MVLNVELEPKHVLASYKTFSTYKRYYSSRRGSRRRTILSGFYIICSSLLSAMRGWVVIIEAKVVPSTLSARIQDIVKKTPNPIMKHPVNHPTTALLVRVACSTMHKNTKMTITANIRYGRTTM